MQLRPYQLDAAESIEGELRRVRSTLLVLATGLGKTVTFSEVARRFVARGGRVLVLAHRSELLEQAAATLARFGLSVGIECGEQRADRAAQVVVASVQTLQRKRLSSFDPGAFALVVVDECFPAGTLIDGRPIETVKPGDEVLSVEHSSGRLVRRHVVRVFRKMAPRRMVRLACSGLTLDATPNHPIFVRGKGYVRAEDIEAGDVLCVRRPMQVASKDVLESVSDHALSCAVPGHLCQQAAEAAADERANLPALRIDVPASRDASEKDVFEHVRSSDLIGDYDANEQALRVLPHDRAQPNARGDLPAADEGDADLHEAQAAGAWREWSRPNRTGENASGSAGRSVGDALRGQDGCRTRNWIPDLLQDRCGQPGAEDRDRGGWGEPRTAGAKAAGSEEGRVLVWARVDDLASYERAGDDRACVYNLEVEGSHTYFANGVLVHNCHHSTSASWRAILDHFSHAKVLGVTATPDRADGVGLRNVFESVAYRMEIGEGIRGGWLSPLELRSVKVADLDLSAVKSVAGDFAVGQLEEALTREAVLIATARPLAELAEGRRTLAFTAGVAQAHALAQALEGYGVRAAAVDGSMSADARRRVLDAYRDGRVQVVANAMLWTEGFDAPETACVALCRPTRSRALLTQCIGRGTRLADGKSSCLVLDFVPGRASSMRLAGPADVLAGADLPLDVAALVAELSSGKQMELGAVIQHARQLAEEREVEKARADASLRAQAAGLVQRVGLPYAVTRFSVEQLLDAVSEPDRPVPHCPATSSQIGALRNSGLDVPDSISRRDASKLLDVLDARRRQGLCTVKQARRLRSWGLRDDVSFTDASAALEAIRQNGWRPPGWMFRDARFAKGTAA